MSSSESGSGTGSDTSPKASGFATPAVAKRSPAISNRSVLKTEHGKTAIADSVVAKIAGLACRAVSGVHDMGSGTARTFGAIKDRIPGTGHEPSPTRGVSVEVGESQAAVDLDIVVEYGAAIVDVAESIRNNVIAKVEAMTGLEVTEVNVTVDDVYLGDDSSSDEGPRVQ